FLFNNIRFSFSFKFDFMRIGIYFLNYPFRILKNRSFVILYKESSFISINRMNNNYISNFQIFDISYELILFISTKVMQFVKSYRSIFFHICFLLISDFLSSMINFVLLMKHSVNIFICKTKSKSNIESKM